MTAKGLWLPPSRQGIHGFLPSFREDDVSAPLSGPDTMDQYLP